MKLTQAQKWVLTDMKKGEWYTAEDLYCSLITLYTLVNKDILERYPPSGYIVNARNHMFFRIAE